MQNRTLKIEQIGEELGGLFYDMWEVVAIPKGLA